MHAQGNGTPGPTHSPGARLQHAIVQHSYWQGHSAPMAGVCCLTGYSWGLCHILNLPGGICPLSPLLIASRHAYPQDQLRR
jgi:hypothetical protein